jgi:hypothetical protein
MVRYVGGRARLVVCLLLAPLLALMLILGGSVIATNPHTWPAALGLLILPSLIVIGGILIRDSVALDLTIRSEALSYRTTFRTRTIIRSAIASCDTEEVGAAYGTSKVIRPYLLLHDGSRVPLRVFGCFKPNVEVDANPRRFREMNNLVLALQKWLDGIPLSE